MVNSNCARSEPVMDLIPSWQPEQSELSDRDLAVIVRLVYEKSGITLHAGKRALVTARLQKRLKQGGFVGFRDYVRRLQADPGGAEVTAMLDAIATNHTSFFREPQHFGFLADVVLPRLMARRDGGPIRGWSAACSTGEEPYTIAITALERFGEDADHRLRLFATDLSTKALARAVSGTYKADRIAELPRHVALKYFDKRPQGFVAVTERVHRMVEFRQLNLLHLPPRGQLLDFIFCRNVMIYFDQPVQQRVVRALQERLAPGGYLFTSHSESLNSLEHELTWVAPSVYRRDPR
jgi:chemotaxis protein methyltransferase CheR